jgi:hypothetical protein
MNEIRQAQARSLKWDALDAEARRHNTVMRRFLCAACVLAVVTMVLLRVDMPLAAVATGTIGLIVVSVAIYRLCRAVMATNRALNVYTDSPPQPNNNPSI